MPLIFLLKKTNACVKNNELAAVLDPQFPGKVEHGTGQVDRARDIRVVQGVHRLIPQTGQLLLPHRKAERRNPNSSTAWTRSPTAC